MGDGKVGVVPHDLLKVISWKDHAKGKLIEEELPEKARNKYRVICRGFEGQDVFRTLEEIIERHHSPRNLPERLWSTADCLSTVAARFRLEYDYWYLEQGEPFFVSVYGDIRNWSSKARRELHNSIMGILEQHSDRTHEQANAFEEVNELLREFPADSRFPFTSLKTHHWLTHAICCNKKFWLNVKSKKQFENIYILRTSIAEPEFHKLKELRGFKELCLRILHISKEKLASWLPLQVGDDLYAVCLSRGEVDEILHMLAGTGFGFDVDVYEWTIRREEKATKPDGRKETIHIVKKSDLTLQSVGVYEEFEYTPEKIAEFSDILEGKYDYVAWVFIKPKGDMKQVAKEFLEWGNRTLEEVYGEKRVELKEPVCEPSEFLSPELPLSIAEGYNQFLTDCAKAINAENPEASSIVKSFSETLFISGLTEPSEAFGTYVALADKKAKLHIPAVLVVVTAKPKYPFWRILELFKLAYEDCLISIVGDKMVKLTDEDVSLLRQVAATLKPVPRGQFNDIMTASRRAGFEELKFIIEGKAEDGKISWEASKKLRWVIDQFAKKYEGEVLKDVICRGLKMLEPFTRRERR